MNLLLQLPQRPAVLMVCHDIQLAARYAKEIILMKQGEILVTGQPASVLTPANLQKVYGCQAQILHDAQGSLCIALS